MVNRAAEDTLQGNQPCYQIISSHLQKSMKKDQELIVITKTYDLILWSCNHTSKFPRNHRFVLGERIERNLYGLLETLIAAKYAKNRQRLLEEANLNLEILRFQVRLAKDLPEGRELRLRRQVHRRDRPLDRWLAPQPPRGDGPMKQYGHLWEGMISFENLLRAAHAAGL